MKSKIIFAAALAIAALSHAAFAAGMAVKAPPAPLASLLSTGYPYGSSGLFVGIYGEGGGGTVNGSVAGVGSASLTDTQAGVGGTIGYAWGQKNSPVAFSSEGDFGWTNINGSAAGLSLSGPAHFEQRFVAFTPISNLLAFGVIPGLPNLGTLPPFSALPSDVTASNIQLGLMAGIDEDDISTNFPGVASNREWRAAAMIGIVQMEQLSNGTALRTWVKAEFPDKGVCVGPIQNACAGLSTQFKAGVGVYW